LAAVRLGFALGVDGPITYPKNDSLREAIRGAGLDNIVLETDSPYLPPQNSRGKRNDPSQLDEIAKGVGHLFGKSSEFVAEKTMHNGVELFRLA
jgi:TatD DNase family protein